MIVNVCKIEVVIIMSDKRRDLMSEISETFNLAIKVQEEFLKSGPFPELSLTEVHVIEAVSKEKFPTMTNVARRLQVTVGTLTTNVKSIMKKGFLEKEQYEKDHRFTILRITSKGYEALAYHDRFHRELSALYEERMSDDQFNWVLDTFEKVIVGLKDYQENLRQKTIKKSIKSSSRGR